MKKRIVLMIAALLIFTPCAFAKQQVVAKGNKNVNQLHDELLKAFPAWRGTSLAGGTFQDPLLLVEETSTQIKLSFPEDADENTVKAVINAHVPDPNWKLEPESKRTAREKLRGLGFTDSEIGHVLNR